VDVLTGEESRIQAIDQFGELLAQGLYMGMSYVGLKPLLDGNPARLHSTRFGHVLTGELFPILDAIPWTVVGIVLCAGVLGWYVVKQIPRKVIVHAYRPRVVEGTDWSDVLWTPSFA
jgi:hypothetical protein